jgi:hypothetical protein
LGDPESLTPTEARFAQSRSKLRDARAERAPPRRDDKVITSWNALAISAFAKAAQVLDDARYLRVAQAAMEVLLESGSQAYRPSHSSRNGRTTEVVFLDDYAFLIQALLDLYETDFRASRLDDARMLMKTMIDRFQERPGTPFRFSPLDRPLDLPARTILNEDDSPSGNAAALTALHRLVLFGANLEFEQQTRAMVAGLGRYLETSAALATGLLQALDFKPSDAHEIVIVGDPDDPDTRSLLREVYRRLLHATVLAVIAPGAPGDPDALRRNETWPLLEGRPLLADRATAYVCQNRLCDLPVDTPAQLSAQLDKLVVRAPAP